MPEINIGAPVGALVDWLTANFGPLFSAISAVMLFLLDIVLVILTAPSPYIVIAVFVVLALLERKWGFGVFTLLAFLLILFMGLWTEAMQTLAVVVVATAFAVAIGQVTSSRVRSDFNNELAAAVDNLSDRVVLAGLRTSP